MTDKLYGHAIRLHTLEPYYCRHVGAMTSEALHSKSDIAAELAWRDQQIARLEEALKDAKAAFAQYFEHHGADHEDPACPEDDTCTCRLIAQVNQAFAAMTAVLEKKP